jgi:hypothetical protein
MYPAVAAMPHSWMAVGRLYSWPRLCIVENTQPPSEMSVPSPTRLIVASWSLQAVPTDTRSPQVLTECGMICT